MFWQFLIAAFVAIALIQLGATSVWVAVLSLALKAIIAIALAVALYVGLRFVWQRYTNPPAPPRE